MSDAGHTATNDILANIEDKIQNVYAHANKDMYKKVDAKLKKYQSELPKKQAELSKEDFEKWKKNQAYIMLNQQNVADTLADDLVNHDKIAASIINEHTSSVYALNYNFGTYQIESDIDMSTSFALYDQHTVERLLKDDPDLLPHVDIDSSKDKRWNKRHINDALMQGILQGESIPKIAKRLSDTVRMDKNAAIRNARTATTGAQNAGRVDSYKRAQNMGIDLQQEWMATLDGRTRHSHRAIDGERVGVGEQFSNKCHYPGDPTGPAHEVYNCRCTLIPIIKGYELDNSWKQDVSIEGMSYDEWKNAHKTIEQVDDAFRSNEDVIKDAIFKVENEDRKLDYERGAVIDSSGNVVVRYDGTEHAVEVTDEDLNLMRGKIFTHNHPSGTFFSDNDIITGFIKTNLKELRASTPQGITYVLKNNGATPDSAKEYLVEYKQTSMKANRLAQEHFVRMIKAGELELDYYKRHYFELLTQYKAERLIKMTQEKGAKFGFIFEVEDYGDI